MDIKERNKRLDMELLQREIGVEIGNAELEIQSAIRVIEEKYPFIKIGKIKCGRFTDEDCPHPDEKEDVGKFYCTIHPKLSF